MAYRGTEIVNAARGCLGKRYGSTYQGYRMDCTGLVCYSLNKVLGIKKATLGSGCKQQWEYFTSKSHKGTVLYRSSSRDTNKTGKNIRTSQVKAGDLLYKFNYDNSGNHHVMIATGSGGTIDASGGQGVVREKSSYPWAYQDVDLWVRMFEDGATSDSVVNNPSLSEDITTGDSGDVIDAIIETPGTSTGTGSIDGSSSVSSSVSYDYSYLLAGGLPLTSVDVYRGAMTEILNKVSKNSNTTIEGVSYKSTNVGYLSDLTHGGQFRFILPEVSKSLTANYENISIPGRSAGVQSYSDTAGISKSVTLELMAGAGLYVGEDPVKDMEADISFVESLVYPDYSSSIVNPPSIVLLYLGPSSILKGVVTSVTVDSMKPYTVDGRPMRYKLGFTVLQATDNPPDYRDVRSKSTTSY